jgi:hypothetical protein
MAVNFPTSPYIGEIFSYGGFSWQWNGTFWESYYPPSSGLTGVTSVGFGDSVIGGINNNVLELKSFSGDNITIIDDGDTLTFSASTPSPEGVTTLTAGVGLSGDTTTGDITIINTAPDQTVTISGGTGITTGGTYPNFTLVNSSPDQTVTISGGTGITTGGTYPNFTLVNSAPDQTVTISGGTGITTGGTYPNFTLINSAPDQVVSITGGTNIQVSGTYPNFGVEVTGNTTGQYLPLSGGTVTGNTIFQNGVTASTISATTYFNLPVSAVTNGTGITATTSDGSVTITNTAPDQTVTISGGTGITTGGTYPNFTLINSAPDQTVSITGGTNISVTGAYPNFGVEVTGNTIGQYLPLSGGTVTGGTSFTGGLTANTISATTYNNLPQSVSGSGTSNYVPKWTGTTGLGNSIIYDSGTNIGIGTSSPSAKFDIQLTGGTIGVRISGDSSSDMLRITQTGSGNAILVEDSSNPDSTPFVVTSGGTVGIGTTSPSYFLEAVSTGGVDAVMMFDGGSGPANANLIARADTTQKIPSIILSDRNNAYSINTSFYLGLDRTTTPQYAGRNDVIYVNNFLNTGHYFVTNNGGTKSTKMSILSTGNVGIGTTSPSEKLHVSGNTIISGTLTATTISATTYQNLPFSGTVRNSGTTTSNFIPRWTGTTALTNSQIQDDGTNISIGQSPISVYRFFINDLNSGTTNAFVVNGSSASSKTAIRGVSNATQYGTGVYGSAVGSVESIGLDGLTLNGTLAIGVRGVATPDEFTNITTGIGGYFASDDSYGYGLPTNRYSVQLKDGTEGIDKVLISTTSDGKANWSDTLTGLTNVRSTTISATTQTISGTKGSVITSGGSTTAFITVSGSNTVGGTGYTDAIRVTNTAAGATNPNKTIRVNITGGIEFLNNAYTAQILTLTDGGVLSVGGGNIAVTSNNDPSANYLSFNNNFTTIYDDGNTHIHSRSNGGSMWINTNNGAIILGNQSPVLGGGSASAIIMGSGSTATRAFANIYDGKTYTIGGYGYLATIGAGTGGGTTATYGLYVQQRVEASEFDATSDERLKDIKGEIELDDAIKLVTNLKPIKYTWKDKDNEGIKAGYSAQQVVKSGFNHLIGHIKNEDLIETTDDEGFTSPEGFQLTMNYDQVTPYHGVVIKHLLEEIEKLKEEIKELKNK